MTNETSPCDLRGWARRTGLLVAATLVLSLSVGTGAHADGGLPGDAIGVVEGAVQQVQPVVETVQPTAPQPVPEVVEQVVEQVVEPTVAQVQETLGAVPGADRAAEPVTEVVDGIVRRPDEAAEEPAAKHVDPVRPAQAPAAPQDPVAAQAPAAPQDPVAAQALGAGWSDRHPLRRRLRPSRRTRSRFDRRAARRRGRGNAALRPPSPRDGAVRLAATPRRTRRAERRSHRVEPDTRTHAAVGRQHPASLEPGSVGRPHPGGGGPAPPGELGAPRPDARHLERGQGPVGAPPRVAHGCRPGDGSDASRGASRLTCPP